MPDNLVTIEERINCGIALLADSKRLLEEIRRLREELKDA